MEANCPYNLQVKKIPDIFDGSIQYFKSFELPLLEELRSEILDQKSSPVNGSMSLIRSLRTPGLYTVTKSSFEPAWGDIILLASPGLTVIGCVENTWKEIELKTSGDIMIDRDSFSILARYNVITYERVWEGLMKGRKHILEERSVIHHILRKNEDVSL